MYKSNYIIENRLKEIEDIKQQNFSIKNQIEDTENVFNVIEQTLLNLKVIEEEKDIELLRQIHEQNTMFINRFNKTNVIYTEEDSSNDIIIESPTDVLPFTSLEQSSQLPTNDFFTFQINQNSPQVEQRREIIDDAFEVFK